MEFCDDINVMAMCILLAGLLLYSRCIKNFRIVEANSFNSTKSTSLINIFTTIIISTYTGV